MTKITNLKQRMLKGTVVSDKMNKTVVVEVLTLKKHAKYKKYFKVTKRFKAHDPEGQYHIGDKVVIGETKPISKEKRWIVVSKANNV
ncbi:MAG: 30S ribosomal protein S17 [Candidatus Paceibacterota bacterium]